MGLGSTAKKLQQVVDLADDLYAKLNDLKSDLAGMRDTIEKTDKTVESLEAELESQRALIETIAESQDIDVEEFKPDSDEETK
ncbi:MAG: DUF5798 family protein [Halodesulfurarchaeum sp.]